MKAIPTSTLLPAMKFVEGMNNRYGLKNLENNQFVRWVDGKLGIDLDYTSKEVRRWIVSRCAESAEPIKYGDTIAIGFGTDPTWVNYEEQTFGVNLGFQSNASCEWKILGGPIGTLVKTNERVALINEKSRASETVRGEPLIYFPRGVPRTFAAGYPTSNNLWDHLKDLFKDVADIVVLVVKVLDLYKSISESDEGQKPGKTPRVTLGGVEALGGEKINRG